MKMLKVCVCLLATSTLALPSRGQESKPTKEPASQTAEDKESKVDKDAAVPEKIVSEKEAIKQLVGNYRIVSGERSGEQVLPDRLADVSVRFTEKTVTTYDGENHERFSASYRLDTQQRPWRIKMTSNAKPAGAAAAQNVSEAAPTASTSEGLMEIVEGRVRVIYALPGGTTPRTFQTSDRQQMFVLEKMPDPIEKSKAAAEAAPDANPEPAESSERTPSKQDE